LSDGLDIHHVTEAFIDGFARLQRILGDVERGVYAGVPFLYFASGRRQTRFAYEFFPIAADPAVAVEAATAIAGMSPHLISAIDPLREHERTAYEERGYEYWGEERLMARPLTPADVLEEDAMSVRVDEPALASRVVVAQQDAGLRAHPITPDHLDDPAVVQRAVFIDGAPAAFGRIIGAGAAAYLADVVTLPAFRGRGLATRLVRQLVSDAAALGCAHCVLTSSMMARGLYSRLGFREVARLEGYQTPDYAV
jgi:ribosomal protein S18 acetylase RimI-like enzyme